MSDQDKKERYEYLKRKKRYLELKAKSEGAQEQDPYAKEADEGLRGTAQAALGWAAENVFDPIDRYNPLGAPYRRAQRKAHEGAPWYGDEGIIREYFSKYGEPTSTAPSLHDTMVDMGASPEDSIEVPFPFNPFDPEDRKISQADIASFVGGMILDPTTYTGGGGVKAAMQGLGKGAGKVAGKVAPRIQQLAKPVREFAEERAAKTALGSNIGAFRRAGGVTGRGTMDEAKGLAKVRELGRNVLNMKGFRPWSTTESVYKEAQKAAGEIGQGLGDIGKIVDEVVPEGAVDLGGAATRIRAFADGMNPVSDAHNNLKESLYRIADRLDAQGPSTFDAAKGIQEQFAYKALDPDAIVGSKKMSNYVRHELTKALEDAVDSTSEAMKKSERRLVSRGPGTDLPDLEALGQNYRDLKKAYGPMKEIATTGSERELRNVSNRWVSPTDYVAGAATAAGNMAAGGGGAAAALLGTISSLGHKAIREMGPATVAVLADKLSEILKRAPEAEALLRRAGDIGGRAGQAGALGLLMQHKLLMEQNEEYRRAVQQAALGAPKTEPYASIGNAIDAVGMGQLAMAGIMIPIGIAKMLKSGNLLSAAADLFKANKGESPEKIKSAFINAAKQSGVDMTPETLSNVFDKAIGTKPNKANQQSTVEKLGNLMDEISGKRRTKSDELFEMDRQMKSRDQLIDDALQKQRSKDNVTSINESPFKLYEPREVKLSPTKKAMDTRWRNLENDPDAMRIAEDAEFAGSNEPYIGRSIGNQVYYKDRPQPVGSGNQFPLDHYIPDGKLGREVLKGGADPFAWMDAKYAAGKRALEAHKGRPLEVTTRSDLIAHDDYIKHLEPGLHKVRFVIPNASDRIRRVLSPGDPSAKRVLGAADKLRDAGIEVEIILEGIPNLPKNGSMDPEMIQNIYNRFKVTPKAVENYDYETTRKLGLEAHTNPDWED